MVITYDIAILLIFNFRLFWKWFKWINFSIPKFKKYQKNFKKIFTEYKMKNPFTPNPTIRLKFLFRQPWICSCTAGIGELAVLIYFFKRLREAPNGSTAWWGNWKEATIGWQVVTGIHGVWGFLLYHNKVWILPEKGLPWSELGVTVWSLTLNWGNPWGCRLRSPHFFCLLQCYAIICPKPFMIDVIRQGS